MLLRKFPYLFLVMDNHFSKGNQGANWTPV